VSDDGVFTSTYIKKFLNLTEPTQFSHPSSIAVKVASRTNVRKLKDGVLNYGSSLVTWYKCSRIVIIEICHVAKRPMYPTRYKVQGISSRSWWNTQLFPTPSLTNQSSVHQTLTDF